MLVFYRSISWILGFACAGAFFLVARDASLFAPLFGLLFLLLIFLYTQLIDLPKHDFGFWHFLFTPLLLFISCGLFFLFLENFQAMVVLGGVLGVLELIYGEHLFYYFHQPSEYRVYTIERVSLILSVVTTFLLSSALFGLLILVHVPLWMLAPAFFLFATFMVYSTLWVSKVDSDRSSSYSLVGGLLLTQIFIALSFLPVAHTTNAALLAVFLYFFLGMSRADFMKRLTRRVFLRYLFFTVIVLTIILVTTKWV